MKTLKVFIAALSLILAATGVLRAEIRDEVAGGITPDTAIIDRPMRDDANLQAIQKAFDESDPRNNVKRFTYQNDVTFKLRLREFMHTTVVLPKGERIGGFSLGDQQNFHFTPLTKQEESMVNVFEVWADYPGADTNLTVFGGSGNIYSFYLRCDSVKSEFMPILVAYVEDKTISDQTRLDAKEVKPNPAPQKQNQELDAEYLRTLPLVDPSKISYAYKIKAGDQKLAPIRIFDDGYFTYFQFAENNLDKVERLPVIYVVKDGYDVPVNNRVIGGTVIAETVSSKWTLRSGDAHLCVRAKKD